MLLITLCFDIGSLDYSSMGIDPGFSNDAVHEVLAHIANFTREYIHIGLKKKNNILTVI